MSTKILFSILLISPFIGFLMNGIRFQSQKAYLAGIIASIAAAISFISAVLLCSQLIGHDAPAFVKAEFFKWLNVGTFNLNVSFVIDHISAIMVLVVTGVGTLIHIFSIGYMSHDDRPTKYFAYLNLFLFNMLLLILGSNLILMFVGWEGVGLCSYLLIGFWFKDSAKASAGMKAFIVNRIGDAGFILGIFVLFYLFKTLEFSEIIAALPTTAEIGWAGPITGACLLLFIGATGKSAQIPLYVWLPDAMAGPTPVSALIHAATMVTAGVYMIVRLSPMFMLAPNAMCVIACIGGATAFIAATIGLAQWDIKKVLAYSTVSQLGFMFLACGVGAFGAAMFHLMTHAFFKALMFLGSGSVIHAMHEEQDIRKMGGLAKKLPITHFTFFLGWLAIIGMPPLAGFFSKDEILWYALQSSRGSVWLWFFAVISAGLTAFYMTRLMALTFWGKSRVPSAVHPHESPAIMTIPLIILALLSVVGGWIGIPHALGHSLHIPNLLEHWLHDFVANVQLPEIPALLEIACMGISVSVAALAALFAYYVYIIEPEWPKKFTAKINGLYQLVYNKYWIDEIYEHHVVQRILHASRSLWTEVDVGWIDKMTYIFSDFALGLGSVVRRLQNGNLQQYALYMLMGVAIAIYVVLRF